MQDHTWVVVVVGVGLSIFTRHPPLPLPPLPRPPHPP